MTTIKGGNDMGSQGINDINIDNLTIKSSSSNNNDRNTANRGKYVENHTKGCGKLDQKSGKPVKNLSAYQAEQKADALIRFFNAPNCREFFLKCIYHLTEDEIYKAMQNATRSYVNSPVKYFNKTCKQIMISRGL